MVCPRHVCLAPDATPAPTITLFIRHPLNLPHVVVKDGLLAAIVPFDRYACPILFSDGTKISGHCTPANAVAHFEMSGLFAGHLVLKFRSSVSAPISIALQHDEGGPVTVAMDLDLAVLPNCLEPTSPAWHCTLS
jgi:hypothetical protein